MSDATTPAQREQIEIAREAVLSAGDKLLGIWPQTQAAGWDRFVKALDHLIALLAAPAPAGPPETWRPIESAPKETKVLLYTSEFGMRLLGYGEFKEFEDGSKGWIGASFHQYGGSAWSTIVRPSHWMPLPSAVSETGK